MVELEPEEDVPIHLEGSGRIAQSLLLDSLSALDPSLSERVKSEPRGAPPYSVGRILVPEPEGARGVAVLRAGSSARFFVGLADDSLAEPVRRALEAADLEVASVPVSCRVREVRSEPYEDLLSTEPARRISLRTRNPLVLGDSPLAEEVLPRWDPWRRPLDPAHLLSLPLRAWRAYAPEPARIPLSAVRALRRVEVPRVELERVVSRIPAGGRWERVPGYSGLIEVSPASLDLVSGTLVAALARLAEYTGLGSRTTHGFGSVSVRFYG